MAEYVVIATWPFGRTAVQKAAPLLEAGRPALDAALAGAQEVEDDPKVHSVGFGGPGHAGGTGATGRRGVGRPAARLRRGGGAGERPPPGRRGSPRDGKDAAPP